MTDPEVRHCTDRAERQQAFHALLRQVAAELLFYAPRLDPVLLEDPTSQRLLQAFLTASPRHRLRVLVGDPAALVQQCPRLLALCRRLPSRCSLKVPAPDAEPLDEALYCADRHHALHRPPTERTLHLHLAGYPQRVAPLRQRIEALWDQARDSAEFQQLML